MLFKEKLTEEQDRYLFDKFLGYPMQFLHDICDIDTKVNIYFGDIKIAEEASHELKAKGFKFIQHVHSGRPFFHQDFTDVDDETPGAQAESTDAISIEPQPSDSFQSPMRKPDVQMINRPVMERVKATLSPTPSYSSPPPPRVDHPQPEYVTMAQFLELSNKTKHFSMDMSAKVDALSASYSLVNGMMHDHSNYNAPPMNPMNPPQTANPTISQALKSSEFKAKNELLANGIRCEKCYKNLKGIEPITKLIMAVREHVMEHFDNENPLLKRFQCRECQDFRTNFVDDFEKHLKKHGSMMSLTERRQKLCYNLCTDTHLKLISELCDKCFPGVFEKEPPALNTIHAVDTPVKAKTSVFPRLDRLYCSKYNIPYSCSGRTVHPVLKID
ncbi:hypothetical protein CAEBREN_03891 [Caenorhabditis brenneri]|uniref:Uncharacterized protein n=1 Tax=Caenorhabditis brenneri TaxID=135651 RepID=G0NVP7_CAEBE|nr:hypothetical protein CAEBREN_03891 [Caenorhabditis brenneri]